MTEVLFYHLEHQPLERVLPVMLERSLERGWRVVVEGTTRERIDALDTHLWTYADDSFLAHGTADDNAAQHPVLLVTDSDRSNGANVRFLIDGAPLPADLASYDRVALLFDGHDPDAVELARLRWKEAKAGGHDCQYWQQGAGGRWEKKA